MILLKKHAPAKSLEGRCLQRLEVSETPAGSRKRLPFQGLSGQSGFFTRISKDL